MELKFIKVFLILPLALARKDITKVNQNAAALPDFLKIFASCKYKFITFGKVWQIFNKKSVHHGFQTPTGIPATLWKRFHTSMTSYKITTKIYHFSQQIPMISLNLLRYAPCMHT